MIFKYAIRVEDCLELTSMIYKISIHTLSVSLQIQSLNPVAECQVVSNVLST